MGRNSRHLRASQRRRNGPKNGSIIRSPESHGSFRIVDRSVPESHSATIHLIERLDGDLSKGKSINIHCRQGIGRSSLIAASLLIAKGILPEEALKRISKARHAPVPETAEQREWIDSLASSLTPVAQSKGRR